MNKTILAAALAALLMGASPIAMADATPAQITAAISDATRPAEDSARDTARHAANLLAFSGAGPGDTVVDFLPGGGYFTRLFSNLVGADGKIYAWVPKGAPENYIAASKTAVEGRANATAINDASTGPLSFSNADVIWTAQNYHDLHTKNSAGLDIAAFNKLLFDSLKPGGVYIVIDHVAATGSGMDAPEALHRIDPAIVKQEVEAAGFVFEEESKVLANPDDAHDLLVFDEKIRGKTDQFAFKFRKPAA